MAGPPGFAAPAFEARGADGPSVALVGGRYGCAYSSIAAAIRVASELEAHQLAGSVAVVPVASPRAFAERSPAADADAAASIDRLAARADVLVELRSGGPAEAFEPCATAPPGSDALAAATGLPYLLRAEPGGQAALVAAAGGRGQVESAAVRTLAEAARNVLRHLGVLAGDAATPASAQQRVGRARRLDAQQAGWWTAAVHVGEEVAEGTLLGRVRSLRGDVLEDVRSPSDGIVLCLTTSPAVAGGSVLLELGTELEQVRR